jgi:hypothetical protein
MMKSARQALDTHPNPGRILCRVALNKLGAPDFGNSCGMVSAVVGHDYEPAGEVQFCLGKQAGERARSDAAKANANAIHHLKMRLLAQFY